jgi:hypothetical protein
MSLTHFREHVLPVLVRVDAHGKVTDLSPAVELTPAFTRLLRQTVDQLITGPATDHGKPRSSQFVMKLGLQATARADGSYDTRFIYLSSAPVPSGRWFWQNEDGHRLALVRADGLNYRSSRDRRHDLPTWREPWSHERSVREAPPPAPGQVAPSGRHGR